MKRLASSAICLILLLGLLAACGDNTATPASSAPGATQAPAGNSAASGQEVTIKFSFFGDDARKKTLEGIIAKFNEKYPNIKVETLLIPSGEYQQKVAIMAASRTAPDVAWLGEAMVPQFLQAGQLMDLSSLKTDPDFNYQDIFPSALDLYNKDGKLYGIPFSSAPKVLFFNKDLFKAKGIKTPLEQLKEGKWTYTEFLNTAKALTDPDKGVYGVNLIVNGGWKLWQQSLIDLFWAFGGKLLSDDGTKFLLNSPEGEKSLQYFSDLIFKDKVHPKPGDQIQFESGKIAMSHQEYSYVNNAHKITDFDWDIAPMPTGDVKDAPNSIGTSGYTIFADTKHPQEALTFLKFMTGKEGTQLLAANFVSPRQSFLESDAFLKANTKPTPEGIKAALVDVFAKGVKLQYSHKNFAEIDVKMQQGLDALYTGSTPKEVLTKLETDITPLLK